jgi:hypothetical protein
MNDNFRIRQGLSTDLFTAEGTLKSTVVLEAGCWYLCTDTVNVYVCIREQDKLTLKRINSEAFETNITNLENTISNIDTDIQYLKNQRLYQKIKSEADLPTDFDSPTFNPNIAYYIIIDEKNNFASLYVFDELAKSYMCTNKTDLQILDSELEQLVDKKVDVSLSEKIPEIVKGTLETQVLYGGDANPAND